MAVAVNKSRGKLSRRRAGRLVISHHRGHQAGVRLPPLETSPNTAMEGGKGLSAWEAEISRMVLQLLTISINVIFMRSVIQRHQYFILEILNILY